MKVFTEGCLVGLFVSIVLGVIGLWFYGLGLAIAASWWSGPVYLACTLILTCGVVAWLGENFS